MSLGGKSGIQSEVAPAMGWWGVVGLLGGARSVVGMPGCGWNEGQESQMVVPGGVHRTDGSKTDVPPRTTMTTEP